MTAPTDLDPRTHAFDSATRLAEERLRGVLEGDGWQFVRPRAGRAGRSRVSLRARPDPEAPQVTEALPGEAVEVIAERADGWAWVRTVHDGYLGWACGAALVAAEATEGEPLPVTALRAHAFAGPRVSFPIRAELCAGARLTRAPGEDVTEATGRRWVPVRLPDGAEAWVQAVILSPMPVTDPASFALRLLDTPYVWGGRSAWGLDCSGLTQLSYAALGWALPRDADQQQAALTPVAVPRRGDLAFFPGHVGVMLDERRLVHANATHMRVTVETLGEGEYGRQLAQSLAGFGRWPA
ncbi:NlpC/P60 family protein [Deinococcus sp. S9]|uniref:C40 family peptidase n=1 Tax=Deinococcus sp. S9 TaxID=2545754 RepID=UPI001054954E|nr:NlpC/P60 family protein [Deinococcus sp. S9]TDE85544.1 peptidase [Deinococcus sp. S9]